MAVRKIKYYKRRFTDNDFFKSEPSTNQYFEESPITILNKKITLLPFKIGNINFVANSKFIEIELKNKLLSLDIINNNIFDNFDIPVIKIDNEFNILYALIVNKGKVLSREQLINKVFGMDFEVLYEGPESAARRHRNVPFRSKLQPFSYCY